MKTQLTRRTVMTTALSAVTIGVIAAPREVLAAAEHTVEMLNKHPEDSKLRQIFLPRIVVVQPGDTVNFVATDKGHNVASSKGMIPEGAEDWKGGINKDVSVTFDVPGFYGYVCTPHASVGMVGLVIVEGDGMMDNLEAAQAVRQRGKAQAAWAEIWEEVSGMGLSS